MVQAYLGLGSNIGDRKQQLLKAIDLIGNIKGIKVTKQSSIYETAPIGYTDQPNFLNLCLEIETDNLSIPHPRMQERAFVLIPLNDIASDKKDPRLNQKIHDLVFPDDTVKKYKD